MLPKKRAWPVPERASRSQAFAPARASPSQVPVRVSRSQVQARVARWQAAATDERLRRGEPVHEVGIYRQREFVDLCRGPHVGFTKQVKANAVKLLRTGGAYWRGDEKRPQLQRIYGTAWHNKE